MTATRRSTVVTCCLPYLAFTFTLLIITQYSTTKLTCTAHQRNSVIQLNHRLHRNTIFTSRVLNNDIVGAIGNRYSSTQSTLLLPLFATKASAEEDVAAALTTAAAATTAAATTAEEEAATTTTTAAAAISTEEVAVGDDSLGGKAAIAAIMVVYFVQGALGLARLATTYYLKDDLHLSAAAAAALTGLSTLPWIVKPLYGFLSDGFPLFGYKRRSYLAIAGIIGSSSWLCLSSPQLAFDANSALVFIIGGSAAIAVSDVVADSLVIEQSRKLAIKQQQQMMKQQLKEEETRAPTTAATTTTTTATTNTVPTITTTAPTPTTAATTATATATAVDEESAFDMDATMATISGNFQSLCWGSAAVGGILSAYFSGSLLQSINPRGVFLITAVFPLLTAAAALLIDEQRASPAELIARDNFTSNVQSQLLQLWGTMKNPRIYLPVLFVFLWQATPTADTAMFYYSTSELGFTPEFLGRVRLASSVASLAGVVAYRSWLSAVPVKRLIFWSSLLSVPLGLTQLLLTTHLNRALGIPDALFALTDGAVLSALGQLAFMPLLALAASLCPTGAEGALFATLMSLYNAAGAVGSELGAALTSLLQIDEQHFEKLSLLLLICNLSSLLPLLFIDKLLISSDSSTNTSTSSSNNTSSGSSSEWDSVR